MSTEFATHHPDSLRAPDRNTVTVLNEFGQKMEQEDPALFTHASWVRDFSAVMADSLYRGDPQKVEIVKTGAFLHDIGKLDNPLFQLTREYTPEERALSTQHPLDGHVLIYPLVPEAVSDIVLTHHIPYRGVGYPRGIKPTLNGNIVSIADSFHAGVSHRGYNFTHGVEEMAIEMYGVIQTRHHPILLQPFEAALEALRRGELPYPGFEQYTSDLQPVYRYQEPGTLRVR